MKSLIRTLFVGAALAGAAVPALAQTNVSINIGQPGFYGRIDIGDFGPPPVYVQQPVIVREVRQVRAQPVYLRVPPGHRKNWSRHCGRYNACGRPVMFVRDDWYTNTYAPRYRERHPGYRAERHEVRHVVHHDDRRGHRDDRHDKHERKHDKQERKHDKHGGGHGHGHGRGD